LSKRPRRSATPALPAILDRTNPICRTQSSCAPGAIHDDQELDGKAKLAGYGTGFPSRPTRHKLARRSCSKNKRKHDRSFDLGKTLQQRPASRPARRHQANPKTAYGRIGPGVTTTKCGGRRRPTGWRSTDGIRGRRCELALRAITLRQWGPSSRSMASSHATSRGWRCLRDRIAFSISSEGMLMP
jgi:hypothetical protein